MKQHLIGESSFNMTRGGGMKILRGALKIFRHPKGSSEKIRGEGLQKFVYFKTNRRGGLLKN